MFDLFFYWCRIYVAFLWFACKKKSSLEVLHCVCPAETAGTDLRRIKCRNRFQLTFKESELSCLKKKKEKEKDEKH